MPTGSGGNTGNGGPATAANIQQPTSLTVDISGNLYFTDAINMVVRKITPGGIISVVAGGKPGFSGDGGQATNAALMYPEAIAVDHFGNIFIADQGNNRIRMVNTSGIITTIAGGGSVLGDGGPATAALLSGPSGVTVDGMENIYVSTYKDNRVRKLTLSPITVTATQTAVGPCGYNYDAAAATATGGYPPYTYTWSPGGEKTPSISSQLAGVYTVTVTDFRGVQATQTVDMGCTNNSGTNNHRSIDNSSDANTVSIYPNPSKGLFNIKFAPQGSVIEVYNELGLKVKTVIAGGDDITPVDANNMPNGVYFIRITNIDGSIASQQKIIKIQ